MYTMDQFVSDIEKMNDMYELGRSSAPVMMTPARLDAFHSILVEEAGELLLAQDETDVADLLADVVVFCFSEARKHGLDIAACLRIVMESNFSKLGEDGRPIKDKRGKFLKGPNYWRPEPQIRKIIQAAQEQSRNPVASDSKQSLSSGGLIQVHWQKIDDCSQTEMVAHDFG